MPEVSHPCPFQCFIDVGLTISLAGKLNGCGFEHVFPPYEKIPDFKFQIPDSKSLNEHA
jgi:hypothetical protein